MDLVERLRRPVPAAAQPPAADGSLRSRPRRPGALAALLCAAWLVPLALNLLRLDIAELAVLLLAVASLLRSGTNLIDRLMLGGCLLAAAFLAFGLLTSVWPWGLAPVPAGGTIGSSVVLAGWLARRRPRLPRRMLGSDIVVLGSGLFAFWAAYAPVRRLSAAGRLVFSAPTTDRFIHFARFDTILRLGGYPFLQERQAQVSLKTPTLVDYPSGSHFLLAVLDAFRRSATVPGPALHEYDRYFIYILMAYAFLVMAIVWAARWVAGPRVAGWRSVVTCSIVAGLVIGGTFAQMVGLGLDSQILGLAFFALAVAVNARPPHITHEQVLICAALLIAVAYCYEPYLPMVGLGLALAGIVYFRRLRRHWRFSSAVLAAGFAIAVYPSVLTAISGFSTRKQLLGRGGWVAVPPELTFILVAAVTVVVLEICLIWRSTVARAMAGQLLAAAVALAAFGAYLVYETGGVRYYYYKLEFAGYVACLVGLGLLGVILLRVPLPGEGFRPAARLRRRLWEIPLATIAGTLVLLVMVGIQPRSHAAGSPPIWGGTALQRWHAGRVPYSGSDRSYAALAGAHMLGDGVPTLLVSGHALIDRNVSFLLAVLNRNLGDMGPALSGYTDRAIFGKRADPLVIRLEIAQVRRGLITTPAPVRLVAASTALAEQVRQMLAANPGIKVRSVVVLPAIG
jgi:hypothetical protein